MTSFGFGDQNMRQLGMVTVTIYKTKKLVFRNLQGSGISQVSRSSSILVLQNERLEDLPTIRSQRYHVLAHVFLPIEAAHDGIHLELDGVLGAPVTHPEDSHRVLVVGVAPTTNGSVGGRNKRVGRQPQHVHTSTVVAHPLFRDERAVADKAHRQAELATDLSELTEQVGLHKGFPTRKFDLLAAGLPQQLQSEPSLFQRQVVR